ncbi:MAG: SLC13 family permease [Candidatus Eremiobacteraeota bacterium]|nr:SLC13 family permease [Candidatus Eremiobacteraeota bacterium]
MSQIEIVLTWVISVAAILAILVRPKQIPEWTWAAIGALALVLFGAISFPHALQAFAQGISVYLFLIGMMMLAEVARHGGVFEWLASRALGGARESRTQLFWLLYLAGILVTALLSNDATAVVLTPAVYAVVKRANLTPMPYLFACAFVSNAASFIFPISNPANLVLFHGFPPILSAWVAEFWLPSLVGVAATALMLFFICRRDLRGAFAATGPVPLDAERRFSLWLVGFCAVALVVASFLGYSIGYTTLALGISALLISAARDRSYASAVLRGITWSIVPLVGGLFVIVAALDQAGALLLSERFFAFAQTLSPLASKLSVAGAITIGSSALNNLPIALATAHALLHVHSPVILRTSVVAVDLGPNLSVSASLATLLWLIALRREGINVTAWHFLARGALVLPPALILAVLAVR